VKRRKIFATVGNHKSPFDRLFSEIDSIVEKNPSWIIFAQMGNSTYKPKNFKYKSFFSEKELLEGMKSSDLVICHAGAGSIINALSLGKKIILVPRMKKFGEHTDDHQTELAKILAKEKLCDSIYEIGGLEETIRHVLKEKKPKQIRKEKKSLENEIEKFIEQMERV
jgi:UDP-N-acetylglucosamine transferase subunit ALG13